MACTYSFSAHKYHHLNGKHFVYIVPRNWTYQKWNIHFSLHFQAPIFHDFRTWRWLLKCAHQNSWRLELPNIRSLPRGNNIETNRDFLPRNAFTFETSKYQSNIWHLACDGRIGLSPLVTLVNSSISEMMMKIRILFFFPSKRKKPTNQKSKKFEHTNLNKFP